MALLWLSAVLTETVTTVTFAAQSVITVTTRTRSVSVTCQDVVLVPLRLSAAGLQWRAVELRARVLRPVGAPALGWMMLMMVDELSDGSAAVIPSPVFQLWVNSLERSRSWFCP